MVQENALNICIDSSGNEILDKDFDHTGYPGATNNQMELLACITALDEALALPELELVNKIVIYTDSLYVKENYLRAVFTWQNTGWRNQYGKPILNADLWKRLIKNVKRLYTIHKKVDIEWVKGHSKDPHNKAADKLARRSANLPLNPPIAVVQVRRKLSQKRTMSGSVEMKGQRLSIRIVTAEYLKTQRTNKYRYEVISKGSKYYQNVDTIFSDIDLRGGHCYLVSVNKNQKNPTITKVHSEIVK